MTTPFHLAFPVTSLEETERFYVGLLGCKVGRSASNWLDLDFFGHQLTAQLLPGRVRALKSNHYSPRKLPVHHFGAVLPWEEWHQLRDKLTQAGVSFLVEPHQAFPGEVGEQMSMFLKDPSGYGLEFKSFQDPKRLFQPK